MRSLSALCLCPKFSGWNQRYGAFLLAFVKRGLGHPGQLVSVHLQVFGTGDDVSSLDKKPAAGLRKTDTLLSLQKQLAAKSAFVLNGRKQAFMDPTLGLGGTEPPAVKWHTAARGREWQRGRHICLVPLAICFLLWSTLSPAPLLFIHISMPVYLFAPKLMGSCPKDGPVATFCFLCHHPTN